MADQRLRSREVGREQPLRNRLRVGGKIGPDSRSDGLDLPALPDFMAALQTDLKFDKLHSATMWRLESRKLPASLCKRSSFNIRRPFGGPPINGCCASAGGDLKPKSQIAR